MPCKVDGGRGGGGGGGGGVKPPLQFYDFKDFARLLNHPVYKDAGVCSL